MKKVMKIFLIIAAAAVLVLAAVYVWYRWVQKNEIWDGPDSVYRWTSYELHSDWVEINTPKGYKPGRMEFRADSFTLKFENSEETCGYALPEGTETAGRPEGEVYLNIRDCSAFENIIFHEEKISEELMIPMLSCTVFEYDGRGEIIVEEYVRPEDLEKVPANFRSKSCISRNDREAPKSYMEATSESPMQYMAQAISKYSMEEFQRMQTKQ